MADSQLTPLKWPAAIAHWHRHFDLFLPASLKTPAVLEHLESRLPELVAALQGNTVGDAGLVSIVQQGHASGDQSATGVSALLWRPRPGHIATITSLSGRLARMAIPPPGSTPDNLSTEWQQRVTTRRLATILLWVSAIAFLTHEDCETVYTALVDNRLYQPTTDVEYVWHAYEEVCEILSDGSLDPTLQIVVPGIMIPDVDLEDIEE